MTPELRADQFYIWASEYLSKNIRERIDILIALIIIFGIVIIINQIRIRKQLRRIQEQLEQKDKPE